MSNDLVPQQRSEPMETVSVSSNHSSNNLATTHSPFIKKQAQQFEARGHTLSSHQILPPNNQLNLMETNLSNPKPNILSPSIKRKEPVTFLPSHLTFHPPSIPKKQRSQTRSISSILAQQGHFFSASNVRAVSHKMDGSGLHPSPATNRKAVPEDSLPLKDGPQQVMIPKSKKSQIEASSSLQTESFEDSVRSKLRDSLMFALEMVFEQQDMPSSNVEKRIQTDPDNVKMVVENAENESVISPSQNENRNYSSVQNENCKQGLQGFSVPGNEVSFSDSLFVKDDLLQGNGLSWASDNDTEAAKLKNIDNVKKVKGVAGKKPSPETIVFQIEAELFKLFGGVNKKYKEKGRSLLFNLKDRNNPELRERVVSGEISPARLCTMSAEELASKELSEWRIAKAEEFAQMVVLPDTDVDVRRLVRKTHKGEFQVDVEQIDEGVLIEDVSVGENLLSQIQQPDNKASSKDNLENQGGDPMQGLEFYELKDTKFLSPIVSLDEFMESLDSEPPFENIAPDSTKATLVLDKKICDENSESKPPSDVVAALTASDKVPLKEEIHSDSNLKSSNPSMQSEISIPSGGAMGELVWEGLLQLSVSAKTTVNCYFKSGEKTSTKEWPNVVEIKGRVRLNAFEKFIHDLPNSRTRSMMVVHFVLKMENEQEQASLSEVSECYVSEERLGFAEPAPGIEIYMCPNHTQTFEILKRPLAKLNQGPLLHPANAPHGLIGVVVSRKHLAPASPHHASSKHSSKRHHENPDPSTASLHPPPPPPPPPPPQTLVDDEDDVPPGFGPRQDDDDLPEFNFDTAPASGPLVPQVQQMRALIQLYGRGKTDPSRGDSDDDIPEWQPQIQTTATWGASSPTQSRPDLVSRDLRKPMDWRGAPPRNRGF